ncbi:MAG: AAA family ATPase, partial [Patulibacter sp.]
TMTAAVAERRQDAAGATTTRLRDVLAAVASSRAVVVEGSSDLVSLGGRIDELGAAVARWWRSTAAAAGATPLCVRWTPGEPLQVDGAPGMLLGDDLDRQACLRADDPLAVLRGLATAFTQRRRPVLAIIDAADLRLVDSPDPQSRAEVAAAVAAFTAFQRGGAAAHHGLLLTTTDHGYLPRAAVEPLGAFTTRIPAPDEAERAAILHDALPCEHRQLIGRYAAATDRFTRRDLARLVRSARWLGADLADPPTVVRAYREGSLVDRWAHARRRRPEIAAQIASRIVGQRHAVSGMLDALDQGYLGLTSDPGVASGGVRVGPLLLLGPTGVGKTELAKAVAEAIFGDASALVRLSMESFSQPHSAERLFGSPPGYVAHEQGSVLVNALLENPFRVILLDEIEKAHPDVLLTLLAALDDGVLEDGRGRVASLADAVVIATSNLGAAQVAALRRRGGLPEHPAALRAAYLDVAERLISESEVADPDGGPPTPGMARPELWGRLGKHTLVFDDLQLVDVEALVEQNVAKTCRRLQRGEGVELVVDVPTLARLVAHRISEHGRCNGRRIDQALGELLRAPLARHLLGTRRQPQRVRVTFAADGTATFR